MRVKISLNSLFFLGLAISMSSYHASKSEALKKIKQYNQYKIKDTSASKRVYFDKNVKFSEEEFSPLLITSIPKCGTHLLTTCVKLLTGQRGIPLKAPDQIAKGILPPNPSNQFLHFHIHHSPEAHAVLEQHGFKGLFIYRDPRDHIVSRAFWALKHPQKHAKYVVTKNISDVIARLIPDTLEMYRAFLGWRKDPLFYSLRFEDLVGPHGGGSLESQRKEIRKIAEHIEIYGLTEEDVNYCVRNLFGNSGTFRKGQIGGWRQYFTEEHKKLCKKHLNKLLVELGYEKNLNW